MGYFLASSAVSAHDGSFCQVHFPPTQAGTHSLPLLLAGGWQRACWLLQPSSRIRKRCLCHCPFLYGVLLTVGPWLDENQAHL